MNHECTHREDGEDEVEEKEVREEEEEEMMMMMMTEEWYKWGSEGCVGLKQEDP